MTQRKFLIVISVLLFIGCSSYEVKDPNSAEGAFKIAQMLEEDERFEEALLKYAEVKNKYPYHSYAVEAELKIADIHFKRDSFEEAQSFYQIFKDLHPKHPKIDYVTYRLGLSYFNQLPGTVDRDLSLAHKALFYFEEVRTRYPRSKHAPQAVQKISECKKMLVEKEIYIADFYFIRDHFGSALKRYEGILKNFPKTSYLPKVLFRAGVSSLEIGNRSQGASYFKRVVQDFPNSKNAEHAKGAIKKYGIR